MIHLVGDFSALHFFLSRGISAIGVDHTFWSSGDGWKSIPTAKKLGGARHFNALKQVVDGRALVKSVSKYDDVCLMTPYIFNRHINRFLLQQVLNKSRNVFLEVAGCDHYFNQINNSSILCRECKKIDLKSDYCPFSNMNWHGIDELYSSVNGFIPWESIYLETAQVLSNRYGGKLLPLHKFPVDIEYCNRKYHHKLNKVVISHGINRSGFKGSTYIIQALDYLKSIRSDIEIRIFTKLPFSQYVHELNDVDIVIDQLWANGYGMNGVVALASGAQVIFGVENKEQSKHSIQCAPPVYSILADMDPIFLANQISIVVDTYLATKNQRETAREYASVFHDHINIAKSFIKSLEI